MIGARAPTRVTTQNRYPSYSCPSSPLRRPPCRRFHLPLSTDPPLPLYNPHRPPPPTTDVKMKDRQRWQPEEDSLLRAYVKQYGPKDWSLISQRMGRDLNRDSKSCLERWKNYLKPGIKKGSLTLDEQDLVISLQAKYGNKWKKIAAEVPGRTAKRLGKWWEVFKEKQVKEMRKKTRRSDLDSGEVSAAEEGTQGRYDHILETFAEKYVQPKMLGFQTQIPAVILPPWMNVNSQTTSSLTSSSSATPSPSVSLTLSNPEPAVLDLEINRFSPVQHLGNLVHELEEGKENLVRHKKEATWRLTRLIQQLDSEKARRRREITTEIEREIERLREEETAYLIGIEGECREKMRRLEMEAEAEEGKIMEVWCRNHAKLSKILEKIGGGAHFAG